MKYIKLFIIGLLAMISADIFCQYTYTLEQCKEKAYENNIKIRTAATNVASAEQDKKEALTKYFPSVSAMGFGYDANKNLVEMQLAPGMTMGLLKNGLGAGITATQPIFVGGQIVNGNKLANIGVEVNKLQQRQSKNEVNLTTEQYFWQVVMLKEKLKTLNLVEKMLEKIEQDVSVAVKAGVTRRNDLLQVQLRQNDIETNRNNLENALALCNLALAQYIGVEDEEFNVVDSVSITNLPEKPLAQRQNHAEALTHTVEYNLLEKNVEASALQKRLAVGKTLPTVAVGAGYMYNNLMDEDQTFGVIFATVSIPITDWWGGAHAIKKQQLQLRNAEAMRDDTQQLLIIKMQKAWNEWDNAYKQTCVAYKSIEQSAENMRLNEDFYRAGTTQMSDLLDAQYMYQQSCDKYVDAYSQYQIKKLEYWQATGH